MPRSLIHKHKMHLHVQPPVTDRQSSPSMTLCNQRFPPSTQLLQRASNPVMTRASEITVCTTEARAGLPLPKSCINNVVIGHRSAASLCNPRSTIILHCFVHACRGNPWTGSRCNFLIDLRCFSILSDRRARDMHARFRTLGRGQDNK